MLEILLNFKLLKFPIEFQKIYDKKKLCEFPKVKKLVHYSHIKITQLSYLRLLKHKSLVTDLYIQTKTMTSLWLHATSLQNCLTIL